MFKKPRVTVVQEDANKLTPVAGHISVSLESLILVWGGYHSDRNELAEKYRNPQFLYVYHTEHEKWLRFQTSGAIPYENCGCCGVLAGLKLYIFGGFFQQGTDPLSKIHCLNLTSMDWSIVVPESKKVPTPRHKFAGWEHHNKLFFFGGFGPPPFTGSRASSYLKANGTFAQDCSIPFNIPHSVTCWNNQLVVFDLSTRSWKNPKCSGSLPLPRAAHAIVKTSDERIFLFGGRYKDRRLNDLYSLNLKTLFWTKFDTDPSPCGRSWHSLSELRPGQLILYGGFTQDCQPLDDCWIYDVGNGKWSAKSELGKGRKRLWHTGVVVKETLYVYGGCETNILEATLDREYCSDFVVINRNAKSLVQLCVEALKDKKKQLRQSDTLPLNCQRKVGFAHNQKNVKKDVTCVRDLLLI